MALWLSPMCTHNKVPKVLSHPRVEFPQASSLLGKFLKGEPAVLGSVQIMIGVVVFLFGIVSVFYGFALCIFSGIMFWGAIIYIASGSLTVKANKKLNPCLVKASLGMNIFSTITAAIAIIIHSLDFIMVSFIFTNSDCEFEGSDCYMNREMFISRLQGIGGVMLVLSLLEFTVSIYVSTFACRAICSSDTQQVVYVSTQAPPSFPTAYVSAPPLNSSETPLLPPIVLPTVHQSSVDGLTSGNPVDLYPKYATAQP